MKKSQLRNIIREELKSLHEDDAVDKKIEAQIVDFKKLISEADERQTAIQEELDAIADLRRRGGKQQEMIIENMKLFEVASIKTKKWVAKLEKVMKYKRIAPEYKNLYNSLLSKVNSELQLISKKEMLAMKELKMKETKDVLSFEEGINEDRMIWDNLVKLFNIFKSLFKDTKRFAKRAAQLPAFHDRVFI